MGIVLWRKLFHIEHEVNYEIHYEEDRDVIQLNFADINDIVTYMPPFRGFVMIRRVDISEEKKRTFFKLLKPKRFHTTYDHSNLYSKLVEKMRAYLKT